MKKTIVTIITLLLVMSVSVAGDKTVYIYHTNDMHSRIEPYPDDFASADFSGKGGMLRRATFLESKKKAHDAVLLFDCGDFSQGTPYYNLFKGDVEISMMNEMHYDAGTIGNHEFDFGLDNMARLFRMAQFPIVCANYDFSNTVLKDLVKPYVVLHRFGLKIGVFGLGPELEGLVLKANYGATKFENPITAANRVAELLRKKEKCDLVICLSHLGWEINEFSDDKLIANTRNIDLVLGGHSHTFFQKPKWIKNLDGKQIPVQQMGKSATFVGEMIVTLKKK